jgi:hypothetical protein
MIKKSFNLKQAKKLVECAKGNYPAQTYAMYLGIGTRDVQGLKKNVNQVEWVVKNIKRIPKDFRSRCINEAAWNGKDFSDEATFYDLVGYPEDMYKGSMAVSLREKNGDIFDFDVQDKETIETILGIIEKNNSEFKREITVSYNDGEGNELMFVTYKVGAIKDIKDELLVEQE